MSTDAGVSITGRPSRLALVATVLSGVAGIPAKPGAGATGGAGAPCGVGAAGAGCVFLTARLTLRFPDTLIGGRPF